MVRFNSKDIPPQMVGMVEAGIARNYGKAPENLTSGNTPKHILDAMSGMTRISVKPMSVNQLFSGERHRTKNYNLYKRTIGWQLKKMPIPEGKMRIVLKFGVSNSGADLDNLCKGFIDCLSDFYNFNDNRIYKYQTEKILVDKGQEFIEFELLEFAPKDLRTKKQ